MSAFVLIVLPLLAAGIAYAMTSNSHRPRLLPIVGVIHFAVTLRAVSERFVSENAGWFVMDPPGRIVLLAVSSLFLCSAIYAPAYLNIYADRSNRVACTCMLGLLGSMSLAVYAQHIGVMWVAIEATALASAPLIYFRHTPEAIEATWKYLLLSSIGVALALLGSFFLAYASLVGGDTSHLVFSDIVVHANELSKPWLHAAFVTLLVGFGTKMGLAPMHTWKPDAYGEAPGLVGALMAGGLTSCAFLAIARFTMVMSAAGDKALACRMLLGLGLASMITAAIFLARQRDFKRMLAYSSIEHMGILAIGLAVGGLGVFGAFFHLFNNALTKCVLFLSAGNLHRIYGSKSIDDVRGAMHRAPKSAGLFLVGFLAIACSPPFAPFMSVLTILQAAFAAHYYLSAAAVLILLWAIFIGMSFTVLRVVFGSAPKNTLPIRESAALILPPAILLCVVFALGMWLPTPLVSMLREAADYIDMRH